MQAADVRDYSVLFAVRAYYGSTPGAKSAVYDCSVAICDYAVESLLTKLRLCFETISRISVVVTHTLRELCMSTAVREFATTAAHNAVASQRLPL